MTKSQHKELRALLKEAVFARDGYKCRKCGRTDTLSPAHIRPKGEYRKMQYDMDNVITLCYKHHMEWAHKDPRGFDKWLEEILPKKVLDRLDLMANTQIKSPLDYNAIKLYLINECNKYEKNI